MDAARTDPDVDEDEVAARFDRENGSDRGDESRTGRERERSQGGAGRDRA